jgi:hypothetical protein
MKKKYKPCEYPECGRTFIGTPQMRYCPLHSSVKNRHLLSLLRSTAKNTPENYNQHITCNSPGPVELVFRCALRGCMEEFAVTVTRDTKIYPRFCEQHRTEYRRTHFSQKAKE